MRRYIELNFKYFNSIKVRLKLINILRNILHVLDFNSIKVRLKRSKNYLPYD